MGDAHPLPAGLLEELRLLSACVVASAVEPFQVRLRNEGFADPSVRAVFPELPPLVGYAATARLRSAEPPMEGGNYYTSFTWWRYVQTVPAPRVIVLEDVDTPPGRGAFIGEVQARILAALGGAGVVTNGAVRDLGELRELALPVFASHVAISHAYAHLFDFGTPVEVGGLRFQSGDLVHADLHGVQTVPRSIAARIPAMAEEIRARRRRIAALCASTDIDIERLAAKLEEFGMMRIRE